MLPNMQEAKKRTDKLVDILYDSYKNEKTINNLTYNIKTYGCQMNVRDSEVMAAILEDMGFVPNPELEQSDLVLLNTCSIRENAHNKVFGMLGRLKNQKEHNPNLIVGLAGCMAQEEGVAKDLLAKYKWLDFVIGTHNLHELPKVLNKSLAEKKLNINVWSHEGEVIENLPIKRESNHSAWVNIMYGCDKFCTYCIVPMTRGKQRSRLAKDILNEIESLVKDGYKEVTLLGQNVNAYGKDLKDNDLSFANLLEQIAKTNIPRIRFVTSHPWDFTNEMIDIIAKYPNIMPYIHLPVQAGSNQILKLMGRKYTKQEYLTLFNKLKKAIPNVTISTDIIVGFPGETEADFNETIDLYKECQFDTAFTFLFSPREGTGAAKLKDDTKESVKKERLQSLNKLVSKYALESNLTYLDKTVPVLLTNPSPKNPDVLQGYTDTMKLVNVAAKKEKIGQIIDVKITKAKTWSLDGELI